MYLRWSYLESSNLANIVSPALIYYKAVVGLAAGELAALIDNGNLK
jgi:hypothetical protein